MTQPRIIFFCLGLLDILMDRCDTPLHKTVASQNFMKQLVAMLSNPKMNQEVSLFPVRVTLPIWLVLIELSLHLLLLI